MEETCTRRSMGREDIEREKGSSGRNEESELELRLSCTDVNSDSLDSKM